MAMRTEDVVAGVPELPEVEMHLHPPGEPFEARVVESRRCTASRKSAGIVRHVCIDVSGSRLAGRFRAGQSFGVLPPGVDARGQAHKLRLYSIACASGGEDGKGQVLATTVKRLIEEHDDTHKLHLGVASNYLCDLSVGQGVRVTGPSGKRFLLPKDPSRHDYVFFATGTGIAPFRGMIRDLAGAGVGSQVRLVMGSPYATDLLYDEEMRCLEARHGWLRYLPTLSREAQRDGAGAMYVQHRIARAEDGLVEVLSSERTLVYICGIAGMELGVLQAMQGSLDARARAQYLAVDADAGEPAQWTRRMLHKQIRPTRRVFLEVY